MRDLLADLFANEPLDPIEAARRGMRPNLPRRFYASAGVDQQGAEFCIVLDGRSARTPARRLLAAPARALAQAIAAEWDAQVERIDPARMPLARLANSILDGVAASPGPVAAEVARYLAADMVLYRAEAPDGLVERQAQAWDPIVAFARDVLDAAFVPTTGLVFTAQPEAALENARAAIPHDPWRLGAVHSITTLTGSALIALALLHRRLAADAAWRAAHVDEDWNMDFWGRDAMALARRDFRFGEMQAAATVLAALG